MAPNACNSSHRRTEARFIGMKPIARNHQKRRFAASAATDPNAPTWLWGQHAVEAAVANERREVLQRVATENAARRVGLSGFEILEPKALDKLLPPGAVHQGLAIRVKPLEPLSLDDLLSREKPPARVCVLDQISDRARIVLTLQELEGRSVREITEITGWSESLVKVQAFRARKEMRASVERFLMKEKRL